MQNDQEQKEIDHGINEQAVPIENMFADDESAVLRKKRTWILIGIFISVLAVVGGIVFWLESTSGKDIEGSNYFNGLNGNDKKSPYEDVTNIDNPENAMNIEESWRIIQQGKINKMQDSVSNVREEIINAKSEHEVQQSKIRELEAKIDFLTEDYQRRVEEIENNKGRAGISQEIPNIMGASADGTNITRMYEHSIALDDEKVSIDKKRVKTIENSIFAGTIAKGLLIGGVVAATGTTALENPEPVVVRITDYGSLPNRFQSDLKDCRVIGAAVGNLSSERIKARIEKLTCINVSTGEGVETMIAGYIAGHDNKNGIRGNIVSKDVEYLRNSLVGGIFSGLGKTLMPQQTMINPFSASGTIKSPPAEQQFKTGFSEGASNSLDRLSEYYIKQAENLQPVIEVNGGQEVDIVFTETAFIGSDNIHEKVTNVRESARKKAIEQRGI